MSVVHGTAAKDRARLRPRVMIYGVGYYGMEAVRILAKKGWPIVAAVNRAGPKIGQDLGRLAGLKEDLGVVVQDCETADFATLDADIALDVQRERLSLNFAAYQRLLGAGINVICHGSESYFPQGADPELVGEIDVLAKRSGVTFTGTGIWDFSRIWSGILIAGPCTELRSLFHHSLANAELANERMIARVWRGHDAIRVRGKGRQGAWSARRVVQGHSTPRNARPRLHHHQCDRAARAGVLRSTCVVPYSE
jgi:2,4-diaminopentanoate dehydrogenase